MSKTTFLTQEISRKVQKTLNKLAGREAMSNLKQRLLGDPVNLDRIKKTLGITQELETHTCVHCNGEFTSEDCIIQSEPILSSGKRRPFETAKLDGTKKEYYYS